MEVVALLLAFVSCTNDISEVHSNELKQIVMTASDFETENGSRTNFQITNAGAEFSWAANDTVGIFPNTGAQAYFPMTSGAGTKSAKFDGGGWALKNASTYGSYYPFIADFYLNKHAIPVDYTGQAQTGDASTAHLGAYDFMAAAAASPKNGNVTFAFKHLGALIQLKLTLPQATTLKSVTLTAADDVFSVKGKVDIMASTLCIEPVTSANELTLTLKDVATTEANQVVTLYMMIPPTDMSGKALKAVLRSDKGNMEVDLASKNFKAGSAYALSGTIESTSTGYQDGVVTLDKAGTLKRLLGDDYLKITSLKVVGPINGDDVYNLRKMLGAKYFDESGWGKLTDLDLSEANIVEGGDWYYEYSPSKVYYSSNDEIGKYMFYQCSNLQKIVLPINISRIDNNAFQSCDALISIDIPDGVTSIGDYAFCGLDALTSVTIGDGVISIGNYAFQMCESLSSIDIPDSVASIGDNAFYDCDALTSVTIGDGVISIGNAAFENCSSLSSVVIGDCVTSIGAHAFDGCVALTCIDIPDSVFSIGDYAFRYCKALASINIGNGLNSIGICAFYGCDALTSIDIPESIDIIGDFAFEGCDALTSVIMGSGVVIGKSAFSYCQSLTSVTIGEGINSIGPNAFFNCYALTNFYCYATKPPTIETRFSTASFVQYGQKTTLHVPERCSSKYKSSDWSNYFINIVEMD